MDKITFNQIDKWVKQSEKPLDNEPELEQFQEDYFGKFRHHYYRFFYHMVAETKSAIALEIGIEHGHTLAHMAAANFETLVIGIDKRKNCAEDMPKYPNCKIVYSSSLESREIIEGLVEKYGYIGVVFQDSSHHYEESHKEFEIYSQFLSDNAVWCIDDIMDVFHDPLIDPPGKSMKNYFEELPGKKKLYSDLHHGSVIGVVLFE